MVLPRGIRYAWKLLRARRKGMKVRGDDAKDFTRDLMISIHRALEDLATWLLCSRASCQNRDNLSLIMLSFRSELVSPPFSTFSWPLLYFLARIKLEMCSYRSAHSLRSKRRDDNIRVALLVVANRNTRGGCDSNYR